MENIKNRDKIKEIINYIETLTNQKVYFSYNDDSKYYKLWTYIINHKIDFYIMLKNGELDDRELSEIKRKFVQAIRKRTGKRERSYEDWVKDFAEELEEQARSNGRR